MAAQLGAPPAAWPDEVARIVSDVVSEDFVLHAEDLDASLDLVAVGRKPE